MEHRNIIGFAGRKRSGKTTLALLLKDEENAVVITIANYLKRLCCQLMNMSFEELIIKKDNDYTFDIVPDNTWYQIIDKETNIGIENIKKELNGTHITNIRQLLQVIGTDVIRKYNEDWHVNKMIEEIDSYPIDRLIVIDDVRFPNERKAILERFGRVFFIVRPNVSEVSNHASETALKWQNFNLEDVIINNNISLEKFKSDFKIHYATNYTIFLNGSIFLHENKNLLQCADFGHNTDENDDFLQDILRQIKNDKLFNEYGIIHYRTCSKTFAERYIQKVDKQIMYIDSHCNDFLTCNPLITENLKIYL